MKKTQILPKKFGENLKKIRLQKKMSQGDIARALNVHRSYISGIERGVRNPSLKNIDRFARALDIDVSELFKF
jgi:transcriptional regulator with XRE-family HTH domain